jgi:hypothetical protein
MSGLPELLSDLGNRVRIEQDALLGADHSLGAVRSRVLGLERRPVRPSFRRVGLPAAGALGAVAAGMLGLHLFRPAPLAVTAAADHRPIQVGDWIRAGTDKVALEFSDGTSITLDPGSRARLEAVDAAGAGLAIETGHADVKVVPGRAGRWHLSVGPFGVDVTGTQFDIAWNPEAEELLLNMHEGKVMVSGCVLGDGRPLLAGEHLTASCRDRRFQVVRPNTTLSDHSAAADLGAPADSAAAAVTSSHAAADALSSAPLSAPQRADSPVLAPDSWQALARAGKYKAAFAAANSAGFELEVARSSAEELSLLGDVARFGGSTDSALKAYLNLRRRFPHTPLSANAAFAIGRMEFDQRGAFAEAERWFANYLAEQPHGPLAREALGRRMEALDRAGNIDAARAVAQSYKSSYPRGPHMRLAERLLQAR